MDNIELLKSAKAEFETHYFSTQYQSWLKQAVESFSFYDGDQLSIDEKKNLSENGQAPVIINKIKPRIDNITATEIQSRTKIIFKARSGSEQENATAAALSDLAYYQQDKQDSSFKLSQIAHSARICGIGWHIFKLKENEIEEEIGNPFEFIWDTKDTSLDLSQSDSIFRMTWLSFDDAILNFPTNKSFFEEQKSKNIAKPNYLYHSYSSSDQPSTFQGQYIDRKTNRILIIEKQYKKLADLYRVITEQNIIIETFDKSEAHKLAKSEEHIILTKGYKIYSLYFTDKLILKNQLHPYQLNPKKGEFLYTPFVLQRKQLSFSPYGIVQGAIFPQKLYNKKSAKLLWLMSARQVIAESNAIEDIDFFASQAAKPDGIMLVRSGAISKIIIDKHQGEIASHQTSLLQHDREIQDSLGIYDESLGNQTNANSGIAIKQRQLGSVTTQIVSLDKFRAMKKSYDMKLLSSIRSVYNHEMALNIIDSETKIRYIQLNQPITDKVGNLITDSSGNVILKNDVRVGDYNIYLEEVTDLATQKQEIREKLFDLIKSNIPINDQVLAILGINKNDLISA